MPTRIYDFLPLSRENALTMLALYRYQIEIKEKIQLKRERLTVASMYMETWKAYGEALQCIAQNVWLEKICKKVDNALDKIKCRDIILSIIEHKQPPIMSDCTERHKYRLRNIFFKRFCYNLCVEGLTDNYIEKNKLYSVFSEWRNVGRETIESTHGRKIKN